jgi:hypothetical protein
MGREEIINSLTWGQGPEIHIVNISADFNRDASGLFNPRDPSKIYLDTSLIQEFENSIDPEMTAGLRFFIGVTALHELVHYGIKNNGCDNTEYEEGELFENQADNEVITKNKAIFTYKKN